MSKYIYTTPGLPGEAYTAEQIATLAGFRHLKTVAVYMSQRKPIAGHVWTRVDNGSYDAPKGRPRRMLVCDDFPGRSFTQDEVRAMGKIKAKTPLQPYVRNGYRVGGHVWRWATNWVDQPNPVIHKDALEAPPSPTWHKPSAAPATPPPAPARPSWRSAWDAEDEMPVNPMRQTARLDSGAAKGVGNA